MVVVLVSKMRLFFSKRLRKWLLLFKQFGTN